MVTPFCVVAEGPASSGKVESCKPPCPFGSLRVELHFITECPHISRPRYYLAMVTSRAFASIEDFVEGSKQTVAPNGRWLAMKGHVLKEELKILKKLNLKFDTFALKVPELDAQRNLVVILAPK